MTNEERSKKNGSGRWVSSLSDDWRATGAIIAVLI